MIKKILIKQIQHEENVSHVSIVEVQVSLEWLQPTIITGSKATMYM